MGPSRAVTRLRPPDARWERPRPPDSSLVAELGNAIGLPEAVCSVLARRGVTTAAAAKRFLRPRLEHLHDPSALADGPRAARRIARAVEDRETILVHGDYDVDGICATALLTRWLGSLGASVVPFVPHRLRDGYDFTDSGLRAATAAGARLIVTADCGTVAYEPIRAARDAGIDVVVTDHHTVAGDLPDAVAVVNPQRRDCAYPEKGLCGAGLAYKICQLVGTEVGVPLEPLTEYLDLVALATVADLVPLTGENRILVTYGLRRFAHTRVRGVAALLEASGVAADEMTAGRIGYVVAPRINAAGRIGEAEDALRLLLSEDPVECRALAARLEETNRSRQEEDRRTLDDALARLEESYDPERDFGVVLSGEGWHPGVIGIVASRVVERIHRPVVLVAMEGQRGRGSARSIPGFHLFEALSECSEHLGRFGGHRQAAGMEIDRTALPAFREAFNSAARTRIEGDQLRPVRRPDLELGLGELDLELVHWLGYLGPHGIGNPAPLFLSRGVFLDRPKIVGEKHLKARLTQGRAGLDAIGFGFAEGHAPEDVEGVPHDVLFKLERNEWRGAARPQARLVALRPAAEE